MSEKSNSIHATTYCADKAVYGYNDQGEYVIVGYGACPTPAIPHTLNNHTVERQISRAMRNAQRLKSGLRLR